MKSNNSTKRKVKTAVPSPSKPKPEILPYVLKHLVREYFYLFCVYYDPDFYTADKVYLRRLAEYLEDVAKGRIKKFAASLPPRAGKSYTLTLFVAWLIGREQNNPDLSIMRNAYGASLAEKFSYDTLQVIESPRYREIFGVIEIKAGHSRVDDWAIKTASQSTYFCAGVGGPITGKGCKTLAVADDLIKNLEEALSPTVLDKIWGWYTSTHKARFEKGCPEVVIATRWGQKDIIGRLLEEEPGKWTTFVVPALDENDQSFCESVKSTKEYQELRDLLDPYIWYAEFMQAPRAAEGTLFDKKELSYFTMEEFAELEATYGVDAVIGYTDTADEGRDYLASGVVKIIQNVWYLVDVIFTRDPVEVTIPLVANQICMNGVNYHIVESNNGGKLFVLQVRDKLKELKCYGAVKWKANTTNKNTRILMTSGQVKKFMRFRKDIDRGSDYAKFMQNVFDYTISGKVKHDDGPDLLAGLVNTITRPSIKLLQSN